MCVASFFFWSFTGAIKYPSSKRDALMALIYMVFCVAESQNRQSIKQIRPWRAHISCAFTRHSCRLGKSLQNLQLHKRLFQFSFELREAWNLA